MEKLGFEKTKHKRFKLVNGVYITRKQAEAPNKHKTKKEKYKHLTKKYNEKLKYCFSLL